MSRVSVTAESTSRGWVAGIEPHGNKVMQPAVFTVETLEAGSGEVLVYVEDPEGHTEEVRGGPARFSERFSDQPAESFFFIRAPFVMM